MSDKLSFLKTERAEKIAGQLWWMLFLTQVAAVIYFMFLKPSAPPPATIMAESYVGPSGCPKKRHIRVRLSQNGCFSPKTLINDGKTKGFRYESDGYRGGDHLYLGFFRIDNDAVAVKCYNNKFFDTERTGNGCFIRGIERDVFVVGGEQAP